MKAGIDYIGVGVGGPDFGAHTEIFSDSTRFHASAKANDMKAGTDYVGVGVGGLILGHDGRILLAQRGPQARNQRGQWKNPGGGLDFGEDFRACIMREIHEELGITVRIEGLLRVVNHTIPDEGQHWVSPTFVCRVVNGEPEIREPGKCSAIGWFDIDDLPEPMTAISEADIRCYRLMRDQGRALLPPEWTEPLPPDEQNI